MIVAVLSQNRINGGLADPGLSWELKLEGNGLQCSGQLAERTIISKRGDCERASGNAGWEFGWESAEPPSRRCGGQCGLSACVAVAVAPGRDKVGL